MERRRFIRAGAAAGAGVYLGFPSLGAGLRTVRGGPPPDLVLRRALIVDGTGAPPRRGDVAVAGDRIVGVGRVADAGADEIDLDGLALAPGFIDVHSHAGLSLLIEPRAESRIRQGVTTECAGQDGGSVGPRSEESARRLRERYREEYGLDVEIRSLADFFRELEETPPAVNVTSMVGHGTVRRRVVGEADRPATEEELAEMRRLVREALRQGAVGLSSGLEYTPGSFADTAELIALAGELRGTGLPFASHIRNEDDRLLGSVEEVLQVGRRAIVPVEVSHLKAQGERNYWKAAAVLGMIEEARRYGVEAHFDRYPYTAYSTGLTNLFPTSARADGTDAFLRRLRDPDRLPRLERYAREKVELLGSWDAVQITSTRTEENAWARGRKLGELARERGEDPFELARRLLLEEEGSVGMIGFGMSEENTREMLTHRLGMVCSDGGAYAPYGPLSEGSPHPRGYGTFPRVLGRYVRERGALSLEEAVHKMTRMPATKLRIPDRGVIREGAFADLVAFDPETVIDRATFTDPHRYPEGIPHVIVNGTPTIRDGEQTGELAGRPLRGPGIPGPQRTSVGSGNGG